MVHKPKHKVHSFRGLLGDGAQEVINLERSNVTLAYRIVKFAIFPNLPGTTDVESTVQIWKEEQSSVSATVATVDFSNPDLLAAAFISFSLTVGYDMQMHVTFDNILFSRNIYVTHTDSIASSSKPANYYIELEEVPVGAATLMQLKLGVARKLSLSESAPD